MAALSKRDREILAAMHDGRINPMLIRKRTGYGKGEVATSLNKLERYGYVHKIVHGLYEITDEGRAALESE